MARFALRLDVFDIGEGRCRAQRPAMVAFL